MDVQRDVPCAAYLLKPWIIVCLIYMMGCASADAQHLKRPVSYAWTWSGSRYENEVVVWVIRRVFLPAAIKRLGVALRDGLGCICCLRPHSLGPYKGAPLRVPPSPNSLTIIRFSKFNHRENSEISVTKGLTYGDEPYVNCPTSHCWVSPVIPISLKIRYSYHKLVHLATSSEKRKPH